MILSRYRYRGITDPLPFLPIVHHRDTTVPNCPDRPRRPSMFPNVPHRSIKDAGERSGL